MFLRFLSGRDYEEEFSYFVFRMETLIPGFVAEASKYVDRLTDEQTKNYFEHCFGRCFDQNDEFFRNFWSPPIPPADWFWDYFDRETPFMIQEAKRIARDGIVPESPDFDKKKVREYAKRNPVFFARLDPKIDLNDESPRRAPEDERDE